LKIHSQFQPYGQTIKRAERKKGMEMGKRTPKGIRGTQGENHELTGPFSTKERRKIQSGNGRIRTCYRRSSLSRTRWKMETDSILIKDNATSRVKL